MKKLIVKETTYNKLLAVAEIMDKATLKVKNAVVESVFAIIFSTVCLMAFIALLKLGTMVF